MKKLVFLTGAGMSVESGFKTFRGNDGLWENYPVEQIATHEGWEADPTLVTNFYNMLRKKLYAAKPNEGHKLIKELENNFEVTVITQNVDNLHEMKMAPAREGWLKPCHTSAWRTLQGLFFRQSLRLSLHQGVARG